MFQSQTGKRILKIPKYYANLLPRVALQLASFPGPAQLFVACCTNSNGKLGGAWERCYLQLPSMRVQILHLLISNDNTLIGPTTFWTLVMCNVDDISLVQLCQWLESHFTHEQLVCMVSEVPEVSMVCSVHGV